MKKLLYIMSQIAVVACVALMAVACSDHDDGGGSVKQKTNTYKIAFVLPESEAGEMLASIMMFAKNCFLSQEGMSQVVGFEPEVVQYGDNDNGWLDNVRELVADTAYKAIVGPFDSEKAKLVAQECAKTGKTLLLPTVTSAELQRMYAGKGYVWCLSEPDIAQSEVMLTHALKTSCNGVQLVVGNSAYGQTFLDWTAFQAQELGLKVLGTSTYDNTEQLADIVKNMESQMVEANNEHGYSPAVIFVPSKPEDMATFDKALSTWESGMQYVCEFICSDNACSDATEELLEKSENDYTCFTLSASPSSGFNQAYDGTYGGLPKSGAAQFYDSMLLLYYGLVNMEVHGGTLNDAIKRVVDGRSSNNIGYSWMRDDVWEATMSMRAGGSPDIDGATGKLEFDAKKYTTVLHSTYAEWNFHDGKFHHVGYVSTDGSNRTSSTSAVWDLKSTFQSFDTDISLTYPKTDKKWALVIATSTKWSDYRHQADAFDMYQMLKRHGFDDDHIVLIASDGYAYNSQNPTPGEIRVRRGGPNVYSKAAIDYDIDKIEPSDLYDILAGNRSERLPHVLSPDADDNVFVFWSGHGRYGSLPWGSDNLVTAYELNSTFSMLAKQKKFRQLLFALEACYGGSIGEACNGIPGLLSITAANSSEPSWAEEKDPDMHIFLSNAFTRTFEETIDENPEISICNLYYNLARTTNGSHVSVYNEKQFGNLYKTPMTQFVKW